MNIAFRTTSAYFCSVAMLSWFVFPNIVRATVISAGEGQDTSIQPELTYRLALLTPRRSAAFYRDSYKNAVDQLYLSLKLVHTYQLVNEVVIEPAVRSKRYLPSEVETNIDQAYVRASKGAFNLTAGKKVEISGSAFFANPSDLLQERRDLFDPLYRREGQNFVRIAWSRNLWSLGLGFIPAAQKDAKAGRTWIKLQGDVWDTDLNLQYTYNESDLSTFGFSASRFFGEHVELHIDSRYQQHQRSTEVQAERVIFDCKAIESLGSTRNDAGISCMDANVKDDDASAYTVLGTRLVFGAKRSVVIEAIQNQGGLNRDEQEMYYRYVNFVSDVNGTDVDPPSVILGRQYLFAAYQDEDSLASTMISLSVLYSQTDSSLFSNAELRYTVNPIINTSLVYETRSGKKGSEFGEAPFSQGTYLIVRGNF